MSKSKDHCDASSKVYWLFRDYDDPDTLVPNDELKAWSKVAREGKSERALPPGTKTWLRTHAPSMDVHDYSHTQPATTIHAPMPSQIPKYAVHLYSLLFNNGPCIRQ